MKIIAQNKKALHEYEILERIEAGIVLKGDEVKALREGKASLLGAFATPSSGELLLLNAHITPYEKAYRQDEDMARRTRKLLLHKKEIIKLLGKVARKGVTIVALKLYFDKNNRVKVELALARHKKAEGKKKVLKERDIERETRRELKGMVR